MHKIERLMREFDDARQAAERALEAIYARAADSFGPKEAVLSEMAEQQKRLVDQMVRSEQERERRKEEDIVNRAKREAEAEERAKREAEEKRRIEAEKEAERKDREKRDHELKVRQWWSTILIAVIAASATLLSVLLRK